MLWLGGTGLETVLSAGAWATWPAAAWARGALLGVPGADAGEAAFDPMNDTGVLQPEWGWEPTWGTEPGFITGAGEAEADGGLDPPGWLLAATWKNRSPFRNNSLVMLWSREQKNKLWFQKFWLPDLKLYRWANRDRVRTLFQRQISRTFRGLQIST